MFKRQKAFLIKLGLVAIFTTSCEEYNYYYDDVKNVTIEFKDYASPDSKRDRFFLLDEREGNNHSRTFFMLTGRFNKDSVDVAVKKYLEHGVFPTPESLQ